MGRGENGQGLAEFALVAPLLLTLVFGIVDFGRGMSANVTVANAAKEGARYLATVAAQVAPDPVTQTNGLRVNKFLDCPNVANPNPAPDPNSAQFRAWQQLIDAGLSPSNVTALTVRLYSPTNNPGNGGPADDTFTCGLSSSGTLNGTSTETNPSFAPQTGGWVQFQVTYTFSPATPIISALVRSITLNQTATMVLE